MKALRFVGSSRTIRATSLPRHDGRQVLNCMRFSVGPTRRTGSHARCGAGVREIRIHVLGEWRVIYVAKFADAVYGLHAFQKKTQQTRHEDIALAQRRYRQITG